MHQDLLDRLDRIAATPVLLVASDFDGTLSPLVDDPEKAAPDPRCIAAIAALAALDHTHAALVSGRSISQLRTLSGAPKDVLLIGSHGAEFNDAADSAAAAALLARLVEEVRPLADTSQGFLLEKKPFAVAFHYRTAPDDVAQRALSALLAGPGSYPGVKVLHGSKVVELAVSDASKSQALTRLRHVTGATAIIFLGDDPNDEAAIRTLLPADLGVRVGATESAAQIRVAGVPAVADLLESLLEKRRTWLARRALTPLQSHSLLSDQRTVAVVTPRGRICWSCVPRIDSAAIFADLIGGETAGYFDILPANRPDTDPVGQSYDGDCFVLLTDWGDFRVRDYLDSSGGRAYQRAGRGDLVRVIEGSGDAEVKIRFAPRLDFGRIYTRLRLHDTGLEIDGAADPVVLFAPGVHWKILDDGHHQLAEATVRPGDSPIVLELRFGSGNLRPGATPERDRRSQTTRFWSGWAASLRLPELHKDAVKRSALVIKALCHGPSGAIAAAATTSLPEHLGGVRNWDYRFCWPRDATLAAASLVRLGNTGLALKLLDWLLEVVDACESPDRLHPIYTVTGGRLPPEAEVTQLCGYADSRPVRISNAAANQVQLDVFGPIVDLVALLAERGAPISPEHWRLVRAMVHAVEARWHEPDHGIWELRIERRPHVYTRAMCWHTVQRALRVEEYVLGRQNPEWIRLRDEIGADLLSHAWSESLGAYSGAIGFDLLDASSLSLGLTGLVPPTDERFVRTVDAVNKALRVGPAVYRYHDDDGLPGLEGGMLICTGWLIQSLHLVGRTDEARSLLADLVSLVGPTGIATEQYCPHHRVALGNFAQAYSHLAIIDSAVALAPPRR